MWPGIDLRSFYAPAVEIGRVEALRASWGLSPDQRIVLLAARLTGWKGHRVLIEAAALLRAQGLADTVFVMAGDAQGRDSYVAALDALAVERGVDTIVRRVGYCADMPAALVASSLLVVPSTRPEAFGLAAVEAQAMGTPVIVSDLGAIPETVLSPPEVTAEQRTGWRVAPDDPAALATAIAAVLAMGATALDSLALRARSHVEAKFSSDRMTEATLDAYSAMIEGRLSRIQRSPDGP